MHNNVTGSCLCTAVRYEVRGPLRRVVYCHCSQCRKSSGNFVAATACAPEHLILQSGDSLTWYASSATAERGFCHACGSNLFYRPTQGDHISIFAGTLDTPTGLKAAAHIFVDDASDYVTLADGLPQHQQWPDTELWVWNT